MQARAAALHHGIAASASFVTPTGHQTNTLAYALGGYSVTDYDHVGGAPNLLAGGVAALVIPAFRDF